MAIAGRVAIVPKGEWSQDVTYDKLDLVTHNGNTFIAYKSSVGVEPVDGDTWMLVMQGIDPQEIENIINGTTPVGNANKLGGKGAIEYALNADLENFDADTVDGKHASDFQTAPINVGFPGGSNIEISFSGSTVALISIIGWNGSFYASYLYHGYAAGSIRQKVVNLTTSGLFPYELSETEQKLIIHNGAVASGACSIEILYGEQACTTKIVESPTTYPTTTPLPEIYATAKGNLPLSGGTLDEGKSLTFKTHGSGANAVGNYFVGNGNTVGGIGMVTYDNVNYALYMSVNAVPYDGSTGLYVTENGITWKSKDILHTGNKPSGTYTGNGSDSERYVYVGGGLGGIIAVVSVNGLAFITDHVTLYVTPTGVTSNNYAYLRGDQVIFYTSNSVVNASGVTYTYFRL